jgi:hypothetical protein
MTNPEITDKIKVLLGETDQTEDTLQVVAYISEIVQLFQQLKFPTDMQIELAACTVAFIDPLKDYLHDRSNGQPSANSRGFVNVGFHALASIVKTF